MLGQVLGPPGVAAMRSPLSSGCMASRIITLNAAAVFTSIKESLQQLGTHGCTNKRESNKVGRFRVSR